MKHSTFRPHSKETLSNSKKWLAIPRGDVHNAGRECRFTVGTQSGLMRTLTTGSRMSAPSTLRPSSLAAITIAAMVVVFAGANTSKAGILVPEQISFGDKDLERELQNNEASSTSAPHTLPSPTEQDRHRNPFAHLNDSLPNSQSSGSSSSTGGGVTGGGVALALLSGTIAPADDPSIGRLPEDHGLSLPNPPGTDLLRPPRA
jgi:hypothetical protein